jgi:hypothetical protein
LKFHGGHVFFESYEGEISEISGNWSPIFWPLLSNTPIKYSSINKQIQLETVRNYKLFFVSN